MFILSRQERPVMDERDGGGKGGLFDSLSDRAGASQTPKSPARDGSAIIGLGESLLVAVL